MASTQSKRQKVSAESAATGSEQSNAKMSTRRLESASNNFGVEIDDLSDGSDSEQDDSDELDESSERGVNESLGQVDIQEQLAAAGPAGVAAAAAIATARKRKRSHSFEKDPLVRKRQQTRLIRKLRACIDEYTMRVGQQAVVVITLPGKTAHNFKVFGAQPLESVIRACRHEIMAELEQALLEQAPQQFKDDANKHELPPLVIDGIPTPVEKMTQAQLRAFIPLMLKYSTGRGKPGWGKDSTRPPWWPETLPWANVRSDARDESEKQRISWTTTLRQIVTNCYKYHGRDDLLPVFDEAEEAAQAAAAKDAEHEAAAAASGRRTANRPSRDTTGTSGVGVGTRSDVNQAIFSAGPTSYAPNFVHTITNSDGTVSLIQVDPANAQILTLPDGTQVRAVRLQTLGAESLCHAQPLTELHESSALEQLGLTGGSSGSSGAINQADANPDQQISGQTMTVSEASLAPDGQIIVTGEDGTQSCYPMSSLVSIPASVYQQFAQGQQLSIVSTDGSTATVLQDSTGAQTEQQVLLTGASADETKAQHEDPETAGTTQSSSQSSQD